MTSVALWATNGPGPLLAGGQPVVSGEAGADAPAAADEVGDTDRAGGAAMHRAGPDGPPPPVRPTLVVAGSGHHDLVTALVGSALPRSAAAYLTLDAGAPGARAHIPGHRASRPIEVDAGVAPLTRPPRRIAVTLPVRLLEHVHLVLAPDAEPSAAGTDVLTDAVGSADGVVYVLDSGAPLAPPRRDQLAALAGAARRVLLVDTAGAGGAQGRGAGAGGAQGRRAIVAQVPGLAPASWCRADDPPAVLAALTDTTGWLAPPGPEEAPPVASPATVRVTDDDARWRDTLRRELPQRHADVRQRIAAALGVLEARCALDPGALPAVFDVELHALSLRATDALDAAARGLIAAVFADVVTAPLTEPMLARAITGVRRQLEPDERTLLVTTTAGVATVAGAVAGLSATGAAGSTIVSPLGVAVSDTCHLLWQHRGGLAPDDARRWLRHAVQALECRLGAVVAERFAVLGEAVGTSAADAVDHGVLLA